MELVSLDAWWTMVFNEDPHEVELYCDVTTPAVWTGGAPKMIDLDLDVIRRRDGTVFVDDEDEFEEHRVELGYPENVVEAARASAKWLRARMVARAEPFGDAATKWLDRLWVAPV